MSKKTVSIVTISQFKRFECLKILEEIIKAQTYTDIIEWVIIRIFHHIDVCKNFLNFAL